MAIFVSETQYSLCKGYTSLCCREMISDVSVYSHKMLVFIDETQAERNNGLRKYGSSLARGHAFTDANFEQNPFSFSWIDIL